MLGRAITIAQDTIYKDDANMVNTEIDRYMAVTQSDIRAVAEKYLKPENRTVVIVQP